MTDRPSQLPLPYHMRRVTLLAMTLAAALGGVGATRTTDSHANPKGVQKATVVQKPTLVAVTPIISNPTNANPAIVVNPVAVTTPVVTAPAVAAPVTVTEAVKPQAVELMRDVAPEEANVTLASYSPAVPVKRAVVAPTANAAATRTIWMEVTAYCACTQCCGPNAIGLTASGKHVSYNDSRFVAADTDLLPFGTKLSIPGYASDQPVEVIDRGGAIKGNRIDVFFATHEQALEWGRQWVSVTVAR